MYRTPVAIGLIWLGASTWVAAAEPATATAAPPAKLESKFFDSNGVKIHYVERGEGTPVLLIHGFTANIQLQWVMPGLFDLLSKHYRVIALDNRGHGRSEKPLDPAQYGIEMVEDQVRLLDHLGIKQAHVVGYSMGGFITCKLLTEHPDRVLTATLGGAGWRQKGGPDDQMLIELADSLDSGQGMGPLIRFLNPPGRPGPTPEQLQQVNQMVMLLNNPKALAAVIRRWEELLVSEEKIRGNTRPVLALIGENDPLKAGVDAMVGIMPNLEVVVLPGADHMSAFGEAMFRDRLLAFLAAHSPSETAATGP